MGALYSVGVVVVAAFRAIQRIFQGIRGCGRVIGLFSSPDEDEHIILLEALKQYSIVNRNAWEEPVSDEKLMEQVNSHRPGINPSSFWNGLKKDVYRSFGLNISSLRERVIEIIKHYAELHPDADLSALSTIKFEEIEIDEHGQVSLMLGEGVDEQISAFFAKEGKALGILRARYGSRVSDEEFSRDVVQSLKYAGTLFHNSAPATKAKEEPAAEEEQAPDAPEFDF